PRLWMIAIATTAVTRAVVRPSHRLATRTVADSVAPLMIAMSANDRGTERSDNCLSDQTNQKMLGPGCANPRTEYAPTSGVWIVGTQSARSHIAAQSPIGVHELPQRRAATMHAAMSGAAAPNQTAPPVKRDAAEPLFAAGPSCTAGRACSTRISPILA